MKTINGVLIFWSEIKIGTEGCELFVVDLEGKGETGNGHPSHITTIQGERGGRGKVFNQKKAVLLM